MNILIKVVQLMSFNVEMGLNKGSKSSDLEHPQGLF